MERGEQVLSRLYTVGLWVEHLASCLPASCITNSRVPSSLCPLNTSHWPLLTSSKHRPPESRASPAPHTLTDAFVHVGVSGIKVSRRAGRQADAHLADVAPLQQNEQLGRALEATVDFRTELTALGTSLAPLSTDCRVEEGREGGSREDPYLQAPTRMGRDPLRASLHKRNMYLRRQG